MNPICLSQIRNAKRVLMQPPSNQNQQPTVNVSKLPQVTCKCGHAHYTQVFEIHRFSSLDPQNPTGQTQFIPVMVYVCSSCGTPFAENNKNLKKV